MFYEFYEFFVVIRVYDFYQYDILIIYLFFVNFGM